MIRSPMALVREGMAGKMDCIIAALNNECEWEYGKTNCQNSCRNIAEDCGDISRVTLEFIEELLRLFRCGGVFVSKSKTDEMPASEAMMKEFAESVGDAIQRVLPDFKVEHFQQVINWLKNKGYQFYRIPPCDGG